MALTKEVRKNAKINTVKFSGDLSSGSGLEAALSLFETGKTDAWKPDRIWRQEDRIGWHRPLAISKI